MATFYLNHEAELYHYGVKGMKWGNHKYAEDYRTRAGGPFKYHHTASPTSSGGGPELSQLIAKWRKRKYHVDDQLAQIEEDRKDREKYEKGKKEKMKLDMEKAKSRYIAKMKQMKADQQKHEADSVKAKKEKSQYDKQQNKEKETAKERDRKELVNRANRNVSEQKAREKAAMDRVQQRKDKYSYDAHHEPADADKIRANRAHKNAYDQHKREAIGREKAARYAAAVSHRNRLKEKYARETEEGVKRQRRR